MKSLARVCGLVLLGILATFGGALAAEVKDPFVVNFGQRDVNRDGVVTVAEVGAIFPQGGDEVHRLMDADHVGTVCQAEGEAWRKKYGVQEPVAGAVRFVALDRAQDGQVTAEEFVAVFGPKGEAVFHAADVDKNGKLTPQEWEAFVKQR